MIDDVHVHLRALSSLEVLALSTGKPLAKNGATPAQLREYFHSAIDPDARALSKNLSAARAAYRDAEKKVREIVTMRAGRRFPEIHRFLQKDTVLLRMAAMPWDTKGNGFRGPVPEAPVDSLPDEPIESL